MSRAFVREDDGKSAEPELPVDEREAPVTARGLRALRAKLAALRSDPAQARAARQLARRIEHLRVVTERPRDPLRVAFGARVVVEDDDGAESVWTLVGPDETALHEGGVSVEAPVARALLGRSEGDTVKLQRPKGAREVTVVRVRYDEDEP